MGKGGRKTTKRKKMPTGKDLAVKDAKAVKGGTGGVRSIQFEDVVVSRVRPGGGS